MQGEDLTPCTTEDIALAAMFVLEAMLEEDRVAVCRMSTNGRCRWASESGWRRPLTV